MLWKLWKMKFRIALENLLLVLIVPTAVVVALPKPCGRKKCDSPAALGRPCSSYFDCQFMPEGCDRSAWFKCDGSKCLCELFGYLRDEFGPTSVMWEDGKCTIGLGGPCGSADGIQVECQPGFHCVQSKCEKVPEAEKQKCKSENGCESGREKPPCHNPDGCEYGRLHPGAEELEFDENPVDEPEVPRSPTCTDCDGSSKKSRTNEFDESKDMTSHSSRGGAEDWGAEPAFRFYSYGKTDKCKGDDCGNSEQSPPQPPSSCGSSGCGEHEPRTTEKPSCSTCTTPPKSHCGKKSCGRPTSPPCGSGCSGSTGQRPKTSCRNGGCGTPKQSPCGEQGCGNSKPPPSCGSGGCGRSKPPSTCGENGCGRSTPPRPPPPSCGGGGCGHPKPPSSCGEHGCENDPPPRPPRPSCGSGGCGRPKPPSSCGEDGCGEDPPPPPPRPSCGSGGCGGGRPEPPRSPCGDDECEEDSPPEPPASCGGNKCKDPTHAPPSCGNGGCHEKEATSPPPPPPPPPEPPCSKTNSCGSAENAKPSCDKCGIFNFYSYGGKKS